MSIKYGNSKKQFVNGKKVTNLEIYIDDEIVSVSYDPIPSLIDKFKECEWK